MAKTRNRSPVRQAEMEPVQQKTVTEQGVSIIENARLIIRDGITGYVFWTIFQGLAPMIWFYPLNELEISGYEAFAVVWLSPIVCIIPGVLTLIQNKWVLSVLRLSVVGSLYSFQMATTLSRLVVLAVGAGISMLVLAATLWHPRKNVRYRAFWGLMTGFFAFLASRIWFVTFVPSWWDNYSNTVVLTAGLVAALGYLAEDSIPSPEDTKPITKQNSCSWLPCGLGLGSLLNLTHCCFGEISLLTRWTVKGYPDTGPVPLPWGSLVFVGLVAGIAYRKRQETPVLNSISATVCFYFVYFLPDPYMAYAAGCCLGFLTMTLWPAVVDRVSRSNVALCLSLASLVYIVQVLFGVWTVAYNFVPYGEYTREHTDWLIAITMAGIVLCLLATPTTDSSYASYTAYICDKDKKTGPSFSLYIKTIVIIFLVGQAGMVKRFHNYEPRPRPKSDHSVFTAAIWTFHFGYDNKGWPSMERAATMLEDTGADVITLLESDASKPYLGNNDLATWLAERLQMYVDFGPSTKDHTWGNLLLSKYPIVKSVHHLLPSPHGELAPAITASVNISGQVVDFVVTHMGNDRDKLDRKLQAEFLAKELKISPYPAVFLGYVTSSPGSANYRHLLEAGQVKDIDPSDHDRWCEYIMYKKLIRLGYARISHGGLSDTEVQLGTFRIPENINKFQDNIKTTITPEKHNIDKGFLFNSRFGEYKVGHGYFQHHGFHMSTPKYFYSPTD